MEAKPQNSAEADGARQARRWRMLRNGVAFYEIAGGAAGIALCSYLVLADRLPLARWTITAVPFGFVATAGWFLARRSGDEMLSIVAQVPQIVFWSIGGSVWKFCAGLFWMIGVFEANVRLFAGFDVTLTEGLSTEQQPFSVGLNLVPIGVVVLLLLVRKRARK